jgi:hypothetical protein
MPAPILIVAAVARLIATGMSRTKAVQKVKSLLKSKDKSTKPKRGNSYKKGSEGYKKGVKNASKKAQRAADSNHNISKVQLREALRIHSGKPKSRINYIKKK